MIDIPDGASDLGIIVEVEGTRLVRDDQRDTVLVVRAVKGPVLARGDTLDVPAVTSTLELPLLVLAPVLGITDHLSAED